MKTKKRFTFILISLILVAVLSSCEKKMTCPVCNGNGVVQIENQFHKCVGCNGEKKVSQKKYVFLVNYMKEHWNHNQGQQQSGGFVMCPMCSGTGVFSMYGRSETCSGCNGTGQTTKDNAEKIRKGLREIDQATGGSGYGVGYSVDDGSGYTPSNNSNTYSDNNCHNCHGTGRCQYCGGNGVVECKGQYGSEDGYMICPVCKGNKRCGVCGGRGKIR